MPEHDAVARPELERLDRQWSTLRASGVDSLYRALSPGANLAYVARRAGTYRIQVRATGTYDCPNYTLMAAKGPAAPMPGHF